MGTLAAGIKEIFATSKNTGSNVMLCGNDGTPDGHMTMANLASVLGANLMPIRSMSFNGDCNTITEHGWYRLSSATNCNDTGAYSWLLNTPHEYASNYGSQIIFPRGSGDCIIRRERSAGVWGEWKKSFFFANINEMANVLGVYRGDITTDEDYVINGTPYGYGLLMISNVSDGTTSIYNVNTFYLERISSTDSGATVTKSGEYTLVIKRASGKTTHFVFVSIG